MSANECVTDPMLDLEKLVKSLDPADHGELGAHVGGGNPRIPMLREFVASGYKVPPVCHRSLYGYDYGMLANDQLGDCVIAQLYHGIQHSRLVAGRKDAPPGDVFLAQCAVQTYSAITGYVVGDPSTDNGADPAGAFAYWQNPGIPLPDGSTDQILGVAQVLPHEGQNIMRGIFEFDCVGISLAMPIAWQTARVWDIGGDPMNDPSWRPGSWGGHQVLGVSYDKNQVAVVTWGGIKLLTWRAIGTYCQLVLVRVSKDQVSEGGMSVTGVDLGALQTDLPQL